MQLKNNMILFQFTFNIKALNEREIIDKVVALDLTELINEITPKNE